MMDLRTNSSSTNENGFPSKNKSFIFTRSEVPEFDENVVRRIKRKVDIRLLPILGAILATNAMDRTNLANVRVSGAGTDIGLSTGNHYSVVTLVFFIPFILLEIPFNLLARRFSAPVYLSTIALLWGVTVLCMGFVRTWWQLAVLRGFLGLFEAGFLPAAIWLVSCWYTRNEVQARMMGFYGTAIGIAAFANILAFGLSTIRAGNLHGWRWILIGEGIITCALSLLGYFLILDFPDRSTFLTAEETAVMKERVERDRSDVKYDTLTFSKALEYACDIKLWSIGVAYLCTTMAAYAYAYFTPIVLIGLGFSVKNAQLMTAPINLCAAVVPFILGMISDRRGHRACFIFFLALMTIAGLSMTAFHHNNKVRLAGVFLGYTGAQGNIPALITYQSINVRRQSKRAYASGLLVTFGGLGGIIASVSYRQQDAPKYRRGIVVTLALEVMLITLVGLNTVYFIYRNRQVKKGGKQIEGHPGFLYTI